MAWFSYLEGSANRPDWDLSVHSKPQVDDLEQDMEATLQDSTAMTGLSSQQMDDAGFVHRKFRIGSTFTHEMKRYFLKIPSLEPFEQSYRSVVGNLSDPLLRSDVKRFLQLLLISEPYQVQSKDVDDFISLCAPSGESASFITFEDLRSLYTRGGKDVMLQSSFLIGRKALNPLSRAFEVWHSLVQASALFLLVEVPFRIAFEPFDAIDDPALLYSGLVVDILLTLNTAINFVTAYQNKQSRWVSDRTKIAKHNLAHGFVADFCCILPLDWLIWWMGKPVYANISRLLKLSVVFSAYQRKDRRGFLHLGVSYSMTKLALWIFYICHWASCCWFIVGGGSGHLRLLIDNPGDHDHVAWYAALVHEDQHHFAALGHSKESSFSWSMYLVSYLWISTTVTTQGVIGELLPQTYEVFFK